MRIIDRKSLCKALENHGYSCVRVKGSHYIYKNDSNTVAVPIRLNDVIALRIAKECKLTELRK